ncbi:MAG: hypothetical protein ACJ8AT_04205 [Hyalangium sp.]|uniref:hypothetical protein n=1 Tax=Hyalangium sp. TaxID=2028555 RepID=UPI003899C81B
MKAETPCTDGFVDVQRWLSEGLLVLGEYHGTEESPRTAAQTVCAAAAGGKPTWLALEIPRDEQPRLDAFLATGDEAALLEGPFWRRDYQDGRSSQGMLGLLREVRRMRAAGRDVHILAFDVPSTGGAGGDDRDAQMAARVAQARTQAPSEPMVLLVGNVHATRRLKIPRSMIWHLVKQGVALKTLNIASSGGTAWMCGATCGLEHLSGEDLGPERRVLETPEAEKQGYDGLWYVGPVTAAPPAWKKP